MAGNLIGVVAVSGRRPWFLVMMAKDANQPGPNWVRLDAASCGKVVVRPVTSAGWVSLTAFGFVWLAAMLVIWVWGFRSGVYSLAFAILATVLVAGIVIAGFIRLVCIRMTELPQDGQSR
jgi:uncharacterized membrane protein